MWNETASGKTYIDNVETNNDNIERQFICEFIAIANSSNNYAY